MTSIRGVQCAKGVARVLDKLEWDEQDVTRRVEDDPGATNVLRPFADEGYSDDTAPVRRDTIIDAMVEHPELIQRLIVVRGARAVLARPVERVLELL